MKFVVVMVVHFALKMNWIDYYLYYFVDYQILVASFLQSIDRKMIGTRRDSDTSAF